MKITINETTYSIEKVTATAFCDLDEAIRQDAILVSYENESGETVDYVVFGHNMPEDEDDLLAMFDDSCAWESDWEVLATVQKNI